MSALDNIHNPAFYTSGGLGAANPTLAAQYTPQSITNTFGETLGGAFGQAAGNLVGGLLGGQQYFDQYGNIDVTAPAVTTSTSDQLEATKGYIQPQLQAAENIYNAGVPELNPLLQGYYDASAGLIDQAAGTDPYTQELATRALTKSQSPFFAAGTPGSARAAYAGGAAITDTLLDRQREARQDLQTAGQKYQDWQTTADFDYLGQFQDAITGVPTGATQTQESLSGWDVLDAQIRRDILERELGNAVGQTGTSYGDQGKWYSPVTNAVGGAIVGGIADTATDWISGFFNEGGEVKKDDWF